jgi:hypothetical protein
LSLVRLIFIPKKINKSLNFSILKIKNKKNNNFIFYFLNLKKNIKKYIKKKHNTDDGVERDGGSGMGETTSNMVFVSSLTPSTSHAIYHIAKCGMWSRRWPLPDSFHDIDCVFVIVVCTRSEYRNRADNKSPSHSY